MHMLNWRDSLFVEFADVCLCDVLMELQMTVEV